MRMFALFASLFVASLCFAEKKVNRNYLNEDKIKQQVISLAKDTSHLKWFKSDDGTKLATLKGKLYSGWVRYFYPNGKILKGLVELREGLAHGLHAYWFENGKKMEVAEWLNGKRNGLTSIWYKNGQKKTECIYKNGKQDGLQTEWYSNGKRSAEIIFRGGLANNGRKWLPNGDDCPISKLTNGTGVMVAYDISGKELRKFFVNNGSFVSAKIPPPPPPIRGKEQGLSYEWYENGQKKAEGNYKDGSRDGLWTYWHENGQKKAEGNYTKGSKYHGLWTRWYENGQKQDEGIYDKDKKSGLWTDWHENGHKRIEAHYINGELTNRSFWYENGQKERQSFYGEGIRETSWYENGHKKSEGESVDYDGSRWFRPLGLWTYWHENGQKKAEGNYTKGSKSHGLWTRWYENGQKRDEGIYDKDKKSGLWTRWYENGQKKEEGNYTNDKRSGVWKSYSYLGPNDSISTHVETIWENGIAYNGLHRSWHDNGALKQEGNYTKGQKHGDWQTWGSDGKKLVQEKWNKGKLSSSFVALEDANNSGILTEWHYPGRKRAEGNFTDGVKSGYWKTWTIYGRQLKGGRYLDGLRVGFWEDSRGRGRREINYLDQNITYKREILQEFWVRFLEGVVHGTVTAWSFENRKEREDNFTMGILLHSREFFYNKLDGRLERVVYYYPNGQKKGEYSYKNGKRDGLLTEWFENGQKELEENYKDGKRFGVFKKWDENGTLIRTGRYNDRPPPIPNLSTPNPFRIPPPPPPPRR